VRDGEVVSDRFSEGPEDGHISELVQRLQRAVQDERLRGDAHERSASYAHAQLETVQQRLVSAEEELSSWKTLSLALTRLRRLDEKLDQEQPEHTPAG